jgi:hypothetical protein
MDQESKRQLFREFLSEVIEMRKLQKVYFSTRTDSVLRDAKSREKNVDALISEILNKQRRLL